MRCGVSLTTRLQQVKSWYYHNAKVPKEPPPKPPPVDLIRKKSRKPTRLTQYQAYSLLFCQRGSQLHTELRDEWTAFNNDDANTVETYDHLFPNRQSHAIKFVVFQQAVLKERMPTMTADELRQVEELIEKRFEEDTNLRDHPWKAMKVDETQEDVDLEKQYYAG